MFTMTTNASLLGLDRAEAAGAMDLLLPWEQGAAREDGAPTRCELARSASPGLQRASSGSGWTGRAVDPRSPARREREAAAAEDTCSLRDPAGPRGRRNCKSESRLGSGRVHSLPRLLERVCPSSLLSPFPNRHSSLSIPRGFSCSRVCKPPGFRRASSFCPLKIHFL